MQTKQREPLVKLEHMPQEHQRYLAYNAEDFKIWAMSVGPMTEKAVQHFLDAGKAPEQGYKACASLMKLGEWLDRWLTEYKAGTVRPGTLKSYRCYIEYYIKPQMGDKQISLISQQDIQRMYRRLKTEGRIHEHPEMDHQLSDSMVRHIHSTLHAALKDAVQAHVTPRNPTEGTTAPKPNYKPKRILTRAELDAFLAVVEQDEAWRDSFQTELMTGLRRGEICGLQWSDFDGDAGTLKVCRTLHSQRKGECTVGETNQSRYAHHYPAAQRD